MNVSSSKPDDLILVSANFTIPAQYNLVYNKTAAGLSNREDPTGIIFGDIQESYIQEVKASNEDYMC
jgi:hypothetical protein